jgi:hypothetical protein
MAARPLPSGNKGPAGAAVRFRPAPIGRANRGRPVEFGVSDSGVGGGEIWMTSPVC